MTIGSMKPGTFSPSRVTWVASVETTLPRMVKVFRGEAEALVTGWGEEWQPVGSRIACEAQADSFFDDNGCDARLQRGWVWRNEARRQRLRWG
jgi:hypothetical protein